MSFHRPQRLGRGALGNRAKYRSGARVAVILVDLDVNAEEQQRGVGELVMAAEPVDHPDVSIGIEQLGAKAYSSERQVPRPRIGQPVHPMLHRGCVGGHARVEQFGALDSDRFAEFQVELGMRSIGAGDASEFLFDQVFDDCLARRKVVALRIDEPEDVGVVRLVADEKLRRPMPKLRPRQFATLNLLDRRMRSQRAVVALESFEQALELSRSFFNIHGQFPCWTIRGSTEARSAASLSAMLRRSSVFLILPTLVSGNSVTTSIRSGHLN